MYAEELTEEGIVKESKDGVATIVISDSENCKECTAKLYCKPGNSNERSLVVRDPYETKPGDKVKVSIQGSKILSASFMIYGIPLILLIGGLLLGMQIFNGSKELLSTLFALGLITVYTFFLFVFYRKRNHIISSYPKIIFVSHPTEQN